MKSWLTEMWDSEKTEKFKFLQYSNSVPFFAKSGD